MYNISKGNIEEHNQKQITKKNMMWCEKYNN